MLSLARRVLKHREEAEDVAQETFLRLYRTLGHVDPDRPLEPWLVRLTINVARSQLTRRPQRREEDLPDERAGGSDPFDDLHQRQLRDALEAAIAALPDREREVFILREQEGLDVAVIAEALGISDVTVRRQSMEARRKVAAWFRRHRPELLF